MKIGFIQNEEDSSEVLPGYAEGASYEEEESGSWLLVIVDFLIVYGLISIIKDLIDYLRAW